MTITTYNPGQVREIFAYVPEGVKWFLLGGPMLGDEGQEFKKRFPQCKVVGFEPNFASCVYQRLHDFPGELFGVALWDSNGSVKFKATSEDTNGYAVGATPLMPYRDGADGLVEVPGVTLDSFLKTFNMEGAVLWLDVEGSELRALRGAEGLLRDKRIILVNVELYYGENWKTDYHDHEGIHTYLTGLGYEVVHRWNGGKLSDGMRFDVLYKPKETP